MTAIEIIGIAHGSDSPFAAISDIKTINKGKIDERDIVLNYYFEHRKFKDGKVYHITIKEIDTDDR